MKSYVDDELYGNWKGRDGEDYYYYLSEVNFTFMGALAL